MRAGAPRRGGLREARRRSRLRERLRLRSRERDRLRERLLLRERRERLLPRERLRDRLLVREQKSSEEGPAGERLPVAGGNCRAIHKATSDTGMQAKLCANLGERLPLGLRLRLREGLRLLPLPSLFGAQDSPLPLDQNASR